MKPFFLVLFFLLKLFVVLNLLGITVFSSGALVEEVAEDEILLKIEKNSTFKQIAELLKKKGLIKNTFIFTAYAWLLGESTKIQAGEYVFKKDTSPQIILDKLVKGEVHLYPLTFPEGYNMYEIAEVLEKKHSVDQEEFLSLCQNPDFIYELLQEKVDSLEGYLFPETYKVPHPIDTRSLIRQMVQNFFKAYNEVSNKGQIKASLKEVILNPHEAVILASVVEKETGLPQERALIAGVFYNRLNKKMRLESDPTILYGMMREKGGLVTLNIRKKNILKKTPYNTYRIKRLPYGPIANPGKEALKAVFNPKPSSYLYFVSRNNGSHVFSKTYEEHKKAVDKFQRRP